jgi:hypothetical protein
LHWRDFCVQASTCRNSSLVSHGSSGLLRMMIKLISEPVINHDKQRRNYVDTGISPITRNGFLLAAMQALPQ